ncbi:chemotaxis protein CheB [Endothiovibrio diazotrophicus]
MLALRQAGGACFVQQAESCVVAGMPDSAAALGAAEQSVPLEGLPRFLLGRCVGAG